LPALAIQYTDFALWQRQYLSGDVLDPLLKYWKQQLEGAPPLLELPTDRPRPPVQTYEGATEQIKLSQSLSQGLKNLSGKEGVTLFITLLSAFKLLLCRYSGQTDIIVGTPIAGRNRSEFEDLIGLFINTQALRTDLSGNPSFHELLYRVRDVALGAYEHQDLPFENLVEELQPKRSLSYTPLFQVWFNMFNLPDFQYEPSELSIEKISISKKTFSQFDLTLYVQEQDQAIQLSLVYNIDLFDAPRMVEMLNQYQTLLEQIVKDSGTLIQCYSLRTAESGLILPDPGAHLPAPDYQIVTDLFISWANKTPVQLAICQGHHSWTYKQLSESSHALAQVLLNQGIKQGDVVAVYGQRSFGMVASMIGVFLSGGVLLTLDVKLPQQRQHLMLQEAKALYLISVGHKPEENEWMRHTREKIISVTADSGQAIEEENNFSETKLFPRLNNNDAAYIFFTSGTSGIPKAVLGSHQGMAHFLNWQQKKFAVTPADRCAQLTGLSFDVLIRDVFLPLVSGATLYLPDKELEIIDPVKIFTWLDKKRISILHTVPSLAQAWLTNVPDDVSLASLRCLFFAGEPLTEKLITRWRKAFPQAGKIVNLYGPTETTLAKCYYEIPADILPGVQPIGTALPETQALVINQNNQLCGFGEIGEIVLRTPFRSLGYINAAEDKQRKFKINPFLNDKHDLLYYTNDRGRYKMNGMLDILGRFDNQVKIRGIRIEPGEIEVVLAQHQAISEAIVVAQGDADNKYLAAYYTVINKELESIPDINLRQVLKQKLPDYMIPSVFLKLDAMPLTPNGKVDRRVLPEPEYTQSTSQETFIAPEDKLEQQLATIWEQVLHIHPMGKHDDFFEHGGNSLLAVTLLVQIEKVFGKGLTVMMIFQAPTISQFAKILRDKGYKTTGSALLTIQPQGTRPPLFFIGSTNYGRTLAPSLGSEQPVYGLNLFGLQPEDGSTPTLTVESMAKQYVQEIQTVQPLGPYFICAYCGDAKVAFEMAQQLRQQNQSVALLAFIDVVWRTESIKLSNKVFYFWKNLTALGPGYLVNKIQGKINYYRKQIFIKLNQRTIKRRRQTGEALTLELQHKLLLKTFWNALKHYQPQPYSERITLFLSNEYRVKLTPTLKELTAKGVEIHEIPGFHDTIFSPSNVDHLGKLLKQCIERNL
jgi:amino acid adenylation domain-containing protein